MLACKSYSATWEYWGLLQGKEHVKSSLINQCLGTDGMAIWALITASWDRGSQTLMRFNKMNDYTSITIRETCKMSWIIMATSHKTREHKTQQVLQKPGKERFLNSNSSLGVEQSLSPARLRELTMRVVLSLDYSAWHMWCNCCSYNLKPSGNTDLFLTVQDRKIFYFLPPELPVGKGVFRASHSPALRKAGK